MCWEKRCFQKYGLSRPVGRIKNNPGHPSSISSRYTLYVRGGSRSRWLPVAGVSPEKKQHPREPAHSVSSAVRSSRTLIRNTSDVTGSTDSDVIRLQRTERPSKSIVQNR